MDIMLDEKIIDEIKALTEEKRVLVKEPLSSHTTFKIGGNCDALVFVKSVNELKDVLSFLKKNEISYFVMGNGSNLLVSDNGYRGVIISLMQMNEIEIFGNRMHVGAGAKNGQIAQAAKDNSLTGYEALAGIPGSIGGGIYMNAGAYNSEMKDVVEFVEVLDKDLNTLAISDENMKFKYRSSIAKEKGYIITGAILRFLPGNKEEISASMAEYAGKRKEKQPLEYPSAGSTFKRPEGNFAGKLIEEAGLKGFSVGGAQVSEKHCGFVINKQNATADDVNKLICEIQKRVKENSGVDLEKEVILLGEF